MSIVSISLNDDDLARLDKIQQIYSLKGRSDAVRASIRSAINELQETEDLDGNVEGVLITVRHNHADSWMDLIQAKHVEAIKTQIHSHLRDKKCLEVMVVSCDSAELQSILFEIQASGKADYVRFVRS